MEKDVGKKKMKQRKDNIKCTSVYSYFIFKVVISLKGQVAMMA